MTQTPPFVKGLPVLGNMFDFLGNKVGVIEKGYQQYGEIFAIKLAKQNVAVLLGPENAATVFALTDKQLSLKETSQFLVPIVGEVGALGTQENYTQERKIVAPILGGRYMKGHVEAMVKETEDWINGRSPSGIFDINDFAQHLTMYIAARALLGESFRENLGEEFVQLFHDLANGADQFLPPNLPLPKFRKRDQARKRLDQLLGDLIAERRAHPEQYDDFLQGLIEAELDDGSQFSTERIISLILLLVFAGFDTTSGHLAWGLAYLLEHPDYLVRVQAEVDAVFAQNEQLELRHLREMPHLNYAMTEVERYRPAVQVLARYVREPIEVGGYHIPANWLVMISPEVSHRMERVFTNPNQYDPERFNDTRCEQAQHANSLIGFGGGLHKCWGMKFAYNEMAVVIAMMLHTYQMTMLDVPVKSIMMSGMLRPDTRIQYETRVHPSIE